VSAASGDVEDNNVDPVTLKHNGRAARPPVTFPVLLSSPGTRIRSDDATLIEPRELAAAWT
jgi:hypothetical protein